MIIYLLFPGFFRHYRLFFYAICFFRIISMDSRVLFGRNLKRYRKERHLSQEKLSEKVNISVKHLSKIERGLTFVSADLLGNISAALEVSIARLFCTENETIYDDAVLEKFDRITETQLIRAMEGIKRDIRQDVINTDPPRPF